MPSSVVLRMIPKKSSKDNNSVAEHICNRNSNVNIKNKPKPKKPYKIKGNKSNKTSNNQKANDNRSDKTSNTSETEIILKINTQKNST